MICMNSMTIGFYIFLDPSAKGLAEEVRRATRAENLDYQVFLRDAENDVAFRHQPCAKGLEL